MAVAVDLVAVGLMAVDLVAVDLVAVDLVSLVAVDFVGSWSWLRALRVSGSFGSVGRAFGPPPWVDLLIVS